MDTQAIDKARIVFYGFFSSLFSFTFNEENFQHIKTCLDQLCHAPLDEQSELAFKNMKRRVEKRGFAALKSESDRVFYNFLEAPVPMTASFILEGRDDGAKRVEMIDYLQESAYRRNSSEYKEHEDHIEFILLFLQRMIIEELEGKAGARGLFLKVFVNILNPMLDEFLEGLAEHRHSSFYRQAALALASFLAFERLYLYVGKPQPQSKPKNHAGSSKDGRRAETGCIRLQQGECP